MYIKITNGSPEKYSLRQLRSDNPNTSFPAEPTDALLAEWDVYPYTRPDRPDYDPLTTTLVDGSFEQDAVGNWSLPYVVQQRPQADAERNVRSRRDDLLQESDWTQLPDSPLSADSKTAWATYRQQLRDITSQAGFPYSVVWPTPPE